MAMRSMGTVGQRYRVTRLAPVLAAIMACLSSFAIQVPPASAAPIAPKTPPVLPAQTAQKPTEAPKSKANPLARSISCSSGISSSPTRRSPSAPNRATQSTAGCTVSVFNGTTWSKPVNPFANDGVYGDYSKGSQGCFSSATCVVLSNDGYLAVFSGGTWTGPIDPFAADGAVQYQADSTQAILCPTDGTCLAYSFGGWVSALGGATWSPAVNPFSSDGVPGGDVVDVPNAIDCTSATFCYAASNGGYLSFFDGSSWSTPQSMLGAQNAGSPIQLICQSTSSCVNQFYDGSLSFLVGGSWSSMASPFPPSDGPQGYLACPTSTFCYDVGNYGGLALFTSGQEVSESDPFTSTGLQYGPSSIAAASCLSVTFCVADSHGVTSQLLSYVAYLNGSTWSTPIVGTGTLPTCESDAVCFTPSDLETYNGSSWASTGNPFQSDGDGSDVVKYLTCTSATFCDASSSEGFVALYNGTAWSGPTNPFANDGAGGDGLGSVQCLSSSFCLGTSTKGYFTVYSGSGWSQPVDAFASDGVSADTPHNEQCLSASFCYAFSNGGFVSTFDGTGWSQPTNPFGSDGTNGDSTGAISCLAASFCYASSPGGFDSEFNGSTWTTPVNPLTVAKSKGIQTSEQCDFADACYALGGTAPWIYPYGGAMSAAEANDPSAATCNCASPQPAVADPVNTATGEFTQTLTALSVQGSGLPLELTATYHSGLAQRQISSAAPPGSLGYGWSDNLEMSVSLDPSTGRATVTEEGGAQITFDPNSPLTSPWWCTSTANYCATAPRSIATLNRNPDGSWTLVRSLSGTLTFTFSPSGQLTAEMDGTGDSLNSAVVAPGSGTCPSSASSCAVWTSSAAPGRSITLAYADTGPGDAPQLAEATDQAGNASVFCDFGQSCAPGSGGQLGDLAAVTQFSGTTSALKTSYSYDATNPSGTLQHDLVTVVPPGGGPNDETSNTYGAEGRIIGQVDPGGATYQFAYSGSSYADDNGSDGGGSTSVTTYPDGTGSGAPSTTDVYSFVDGVEQSEAVDTGGTNQTKSYGRDLATLIPTSTVDLDGNTTSTTVGLSAGGTALPSANVVASSDGVGNTTTDAYTPSNQAWCSVDAADSANGTQCPTTEPTAPPAAGTAIGYTLTIYNPSDQVASTTDPLGNTSAFAYTAGVAGVPNGLRYCTVDPADYAKGVSCPAYGVTHVAGTATTTFDATGDVLTSTDVNGNTTTYAYGSPANPGLPTVTTDPDGTVTTDAYNSAGQILASAVTGSGRSTYSATTQYAYDARGRKYCEVGPAEYSQSIRCPSTPPTTPPTGTPGYTDTIYNSNGQVISTTNPIGGTTQYAYDGEGNEYCTVTPTNYAAGTRCPTSFPSVPNPGSDPYLGATIDNLDAQDRVVQVTNPLGGITLSTYDPAGNLKQTTVESNDAINAQNVVTATAYDADNRVISTTLGSGSSSPATTLTSYDPNGNAFCSVSANAVAAGSSAYQCPAWQPSWITAPPSPTALYSTTPSSAQANNVTTSFFNADGAQVQTTNPDVQTSISALDADGRTYCTSDPVNVSTWLGANPSGTYPYLCPGSPPASPPAQGSNPGYSTTIFDPAGRTLSSTDQLGNTTAYAYDPAGHTSSVTDPRGQVTTSCYYWQSGTGQCAAGAPAGGGSGDDLYSQTTPATSADPSGGTTTYQYYPGDQVSITASPGGSTWDIYDANGNLGIAAHFSPQAGYATSSNVTYSYNPDGSRSQMVDGTGTTAYGYDAAGDATSQQFTPAAGSALAPNNVSHAYFTTGVLESVSYPSSGSNTPTATYTYDGRGNMASVSDGLGHTTVFLTDASGNSTAQLNNVSGFAPYGTSANTVAYDNGNQSTGTTTTMANSCVLTQNFGGSGGARNANGQVTQDAEQTTTGCPTQTSYQRNYSYDQAGQVVYQGSAAQGANPNNFAYDPSGDPTTLTNHSGGTQYTWSNGYDNAGEVTSQAGGYIQSTISYDTLGDRALSRLNGAQYATADRYDQLGRMASSAVQVPGTGSTVSSTTASYAYTGDGLQASATSLAPWAQANLSNSQPITGVSCASSSFCMAIDNAGHSLSYNGTVWTQLTAPDTLSAVSCPTTTWCMAVTPDGKKVIYNHGGWGLDKRIDGTTALNSVSCTSTTACVAVDAAGHALTYTGVPTWSSATIDGSTSLSTVSCTSSTFCVAGDAGGYTLTFNGSGWTKSSSPLQSNTKVNGVSCTGTSSCVAVDSSGQAFAYNGSTWTSRLTTPSPLDAVSCSSSTSCVAVDASGNAWAYAGSAWSPAATSTNVLNAPTALATVSCASTSFCVSGDANGSLWTGAATYQTTQLTWDTSGGLSQVLSDGTNDYIFGPNGEPVEQVNVTSSPPSNNPTFLTYSPSNSSWVVSNAAGQEVSYYRYDAFGTLAVGSPTSAFGYAGQYQTTTSNGTPLQNMRARWYDPGSGQFTSRDPAFAQTDQAYAYASGDPVNRSDPSGQMTVSSDIRTILNIWGASDSTIATTSKFVQVNGGSVYGPVYLIGESFNRSCVSFAGIVNVGSNCSPSPHDAPTMEAATRDVYQVLWSGLYRNEFPDTSSCVSPIDGGTVVGGARCFIDDVVLPQAVGGDYADESAYWWAFEKESIVMDTARRIQFLREIVGRGITKIETSAYVTSDAGASCG